MLNINERLKERHMIFTILTKQHSTFYRHISKHHVTTILQLSKKALKVKTIFPCDIGKDHFIQYAPFLSSLITISKTQYDFLFLSWKIFRKNFLVNDETLADASNLFENTLWYYTLRKWVDRIYLDTNVVSRIWIPEI